MLVFEFFVDEILGDRDITFFFLVFDIIFFKVVLFKVVESNLNVFKYIFWYFC